MRLIDADELTNEVIHDMAIAALHSNVKYFSIVNDIVVAFSETINNAPTIDAEPVVRCKDCKHYIPSERIPHEGWCDDALQNVFKEDFYCGFGKRREP